MVNANKVIITGGVISSLFVTTAIYYNFDSEVTLDTVFGTIFAGFAGFMLGANIGYIIEVPS